MWNKFKLYSSGIITGMWIIFIIVNISVKNGVVFSTEYEVGKLIIGGVFVLGMSLYHWVTHERN